MKDTNYGIIKIPTTLLKKIDKKLKQNGYRSRNEFCIDSIRQLLNKYKKKI